MGSSGWYVGFILAFVIVWVVVIIVATILSLARRVSVQAREISVALNAAGNNTDVLRALPAVNHMISSVFGVVRAVRVQVLDRGEER